MIKFTENITRKDKNYIDRTKVIAQASKCIRAKYGTVIITKDGRPAGDGYNGKPRGSCNDDVCYRVGLAPNAPKENCCVHSEANAIMFSSPVERLGGTMYVSGIPCNDCALLILQSGVSRLVWLDDPDSPHKGSSTEDFWNKYGGDLEIVRFSYEDYNRMFGEKG
jgi:dCMP deaminase